MLPLPIIKRVLLTVPPHHLIRRIFSIFREKKEDISQRENDLLNDTRLSEHAIPVERFYLREGTIDMSGISAETAGYFAGMHLEHRFDLLGSGWVQYTYHSLPLGVEGHRYQSGLNGITPDSQGKKM